MDTKKEANHKFYQNLGKLFYTMAAIDNNVRAIQVKQFDKHNHTIGTDFLHSIIEKHYKSNNQQCPSLGEYMKTNIALRFLRK